MQIEILDLEKPQNLRERRAFYKFFYNTNATVGNFIDEKSFRKCTLGEIENSCSQSLRKTIHDFFKDMYKNLNLPQLVSNIIHEYLIMGNCTVFSEFGNTVVWKKVSILPPDQVRVRLIPVTGEVQLDLMRDPETLRELNLKRKRKIKSGIVPLNLDPNAGTFAYLFARRQSIYDTIGTSLLERHFRELSLNINPTLMIPKQEMLLINEHIERFIEEYLFKPAAIKKGFIWGYLKNKPEILYPKVIIS